jgi:Tol biopolymer transport system component
MLGRSSSNWVSAVATRLTSNPGLEYFPSLSPDGKSLVYASRASGNFDIYLKRIGSRKPVNLTEESQVQETQPAFSPDGKRVVFRRTSRDGGGIYVMTEGGESVKQLTDVISNMDDQPGRQRSSPDNRCPHAGRRGASHLVT